MTLEAKYFPREEAGGHGRDAATVVRMYQCTNVYSRLPTICVSVDDPTDTHTLRIHMGDWVIYGVGGGSHWRPFAPSWQAQLACVQSAKSAASNLSSST